MSGADKTSAKSKTAKRRQQRRDAKRKLETNVSESIETSVRHADLYVGASLSPLSSLAEILTVQQYTTLIGIVKGTHSNPGGEGPRTPFFDAVVNPLSNDRVKAYFSEFMDAMAEMYPSEVTEHEAFKAIESAQLEKFGPYRNATWKEIRAKLVKYYAKRKPLRVSSQRLTKYVHMVADELINANDGNFLTPTSIEKAFEGIPKNTFYGWPHFTSAWYSDPSIVAETVDKAQAIMDLDDAAVWEYHSAPWIVFSRVVPDGLTANKVRATLAPAKFGSVFEKSFTSPVIDAFKRTSWGRGYAGNHVVGPYIRHAVRTRNNCFSMDYSGFDTTCGREARVLVRDALKIAFGDQYDAQLDVMFNAFDRPDVITPDGVVVAAPDDAFDFGLGSGIGPTGVIGSVWNRICALYLYDEATAEWGITDFIHFGYGDDTFLGWNGPAIPAKWFAERLARLNMVINPDKQEYGIGEDRFASFLAKQYYFVPSTGTVTKGVYSIARAFTRLLFKDVQKEQSDKWIREAYEGLSPVGCDMLDAIALLEECADHPWHSHFVEFVRKYHPLRLKTSHYLRNDAFASGESNVDGLAAFKTVRVVRELERERADLIGNEEENWTRYVVGKYALSVFRSKGFPIKATQAADYLTTGKVEWDGEQLAVTVATGLSRVQPLAERVKDLEFRKGIVLNPSQVEDLRYGRKIFWSEEQRVAMNSFGNLTNAEKDLRRAQVARLVASRVLNEVRPQLDLEALLHDLAIELEGRGLSMTSYYPQSGVIDSTVTS